MIGASVSIVVCPEESARLLKKEVVVLPFSCTETATESMILPPALVMVMLGMIVLSHFSRLGCGLLILDKVILNMFEGGLAFRPSTQQRH